MLIPKPFFPIEAEQIGLNHRVSLLGRTITFGADSLPLSIMTNGHELLAGSMRLCGIEDGEPIIWDENYPDNESESFIQRRDDAEMTLCGAMACKRFIIDTAITVGYDGCMDFDVKLMPRGKTVAQVFGLADVKPLQYKLDRLQLEIPLKKDIARCFNCYPNGDIRLSDGRTIAKGTTTYAGSLFDADMALPFKTLFWTGSDDAGLGFYAENDRNWQSESAHRVIDLIHDGDRLILRVRLLDSHPESWTADFEQGSYAYAPLTLRFGLQPTPVKPFPRQPYLHNALHLDCFIKIKGNYRDFLMAEKDGKNRFDRLKDKGVTTLILHEKWNKSQNFFELSEYTTEQIRLIVRECHKRGIRVLTYFGYEMSVLSPEWSDTESAVTTRTEQGAYEGGWYRVPYQRDYVVCYRSDWKKRLVDGIARIMDTCHTDGVYLDGTAQPRLCFNTEHGCGWIDVHGKTHGSYPLQAIRELFRNLYSAVESHGGMISVHSFACVNFMALPYIHQSWYGEDLQFDYCHGKLEDFPLEHFRAAYTGRNMGVPVELIAYENRPIWTFENAMALGAIHGILPRPNDIEGPLDLMSEIWPIVNNFPVAQSEWKPYWTNDAEASSPRVKVSYYRYTAPDGQIMLLVFCANITSQPVENVTLTLNEPVSGWTICTAGHDLTNAEKQGNALRFNAYDYVILLAR